MENIPVPEATLAVEEQGTVTLFIPDDCHLPLLPAPCLPFHTESLTSSPRLLSVLHLSQFPVSV